MPFCADDTGRVRENAHLEFKAAQGGLPKSLWETYSAFANSDGGTIVLGVREHADGSLEVCGVADPHGLVAAFWNIAHNPSKVSACLLASSDVSIEEMEGASVVVVDVPRADRLQRPVFIGGNPLTGTYRRNGEGDYRCSEEEVRAMMRDASPSSLDELVAARATLDDLCAESVAAYRNVFASLRPSHPWCRLSDCDFLVRLKAAILDREGEVVRPTRAGLLMFGYEYVILDEFPDYLLDYREVRTGIRWDDRVVSSDGTWSGNVFDFWTRVLPRLTEGLKVPFELNGELRRVDDTPLHKAVREALTNALVHADYQGRRGVVVVRRGDRVELSNPGGMRIGADVAFAGGITDARNAAIARMFSLIGAGERAGSGLEFIRLTSERYGLPRPELIEEHGPDRTTLTLFLTCEGDRDVRCGARYDARAKRPRGRSLSDQDGPCGEDGEIDLIPVVLSGPTDKERLIRLFVTTSRVSRSDVQRKLGLGETKAKRLLVSLRDEGVLDSHGSGRGTYYTLAQ